MSAVSGPCQIDTPPRPPDDLFPSPPVRAKLKRQSNSNQTKLITKQQTLATVLLLIGERERWMKPNWQIEKLIANVDH